MEKKAEKLYTKYEQLPKELSFDGAAEYLTAIAARHQEKDALVVALYGKPDSGKSELVRTLHKKLEAREEGKSKLIYSAENSSREAMARFAKFMERWPERHVSLFVVQNGDMHFVAVDGSVFRALKRFPEIVAIIYNPKEEAPNPERIQEMVMEQRKQIADTKEVVNFPEPEIILISNPETQKKHSQPDI